MSGKNMKISMGQVNFDPRDLEGNDEAIVEIGRRIGKRTLLALLFDHKIRVSSGADGRFNLVAGHAVFRVLRSQLNENDKITVSVCADSDPIEPSIFEAVSLLLLPVLIGRSSKELRWTFERLKRRVDLSKLGTDFDLDEVWKTILQKQERSGRSKASERPTEQPMPMPGSAVPLQDKERKRRRGRPKKVEKPAETNTGPAATIEGQAFRHDAPGRTDDCERKSPEADAGVSNSGSTAAQGQTMDGNKPADGGETQGLGEGMPQ